MTALQALRAYPSISLLARTRPGPVMHPEDLATLRTLAGQARQRLAAEHMTNPRPLLDALDTMIRDAAGRPTDQAVALFASAAHSRRFDLPIPVVDRCVIDPTFATRDLVRALRHTPRHTVLLLSTDHARLLHGHGTTLVPAPGSAFPARRRTDGRHAGRGAEKPIEFLRRVDRALGAALRRYPMPLLLVAAEPTAGNFRRLSRNTTRLAGLVKGNHLTTPTDTLVDLISPVLRDHLRSRAQQALDLIEQRTAEGPTPTSSTTPSTNSSKSCSAGAAGSPCSNPESYPTAPTSH
uniref:baeRF3 domain-containing protein n=1 Tax=Saccharothrix mutabilis TaxID=33921 RepID=UPI0031D1E452